MFNIKRVHEPYSRLNNTIVPPRTGIFSIVGTDTDIGKTYITCQILRYLANAGHKVVGLKPIASGMNDTPYGHINEDVYHLYQASNVKLDVCQINPFALSQAIAPHIAARLEQVSLNISNVADKIQNTINIIHSQIVDEHLSRQNDVLLADKAIAYVLIEGAGGIMTPLNLEETYLDLLIKWNYPVIMVVGMKLGCLNHALLTQANLINAGLNVVGWAANCIQEKMPAFSDNLDYLKTELHLPLIAIVPYKDDIQITADFLKVFKCN